MTKIQLGTFILVDSWISNGWYKKEVVVAVVTQA